MKLDRSTQSRDIIAWALKAYPDLLMTSGFNVNGVVLIDLAVQAGYEGEVVFVDTGYHFAETLGTRDAIAARYPQLAVVTLSANRPDDRMFARDPDRCCALRKIKPLQDYLVQKQPSALLSGRSRDQTLARADLEIVETGQGRIRINPLAYWNREEIERYATEHQLPVNPLYREGFLSFGCAPCTRAVRPGEDARAGRWSGTGKTECGLWFGKDTL